MRNTHNTMKNKIIAVDVDGVLTYEDMHGEYEYATPNWEAINHVNKLYDEGNYILIYTGRCTHGRKWSELTIDQLECWGLNFDELNCDKPFVDVLIDDKSFKSVEEYIEYAQKK